MSDQRNESTPESSFVNFIIILTVLSSILWIGTRTVRYMYDTEITFYNKTYIAAYDECISDLPRNKDCEYVSIKFKVVSKE